MWLYHTELSPSFHSTSTQFTFLIVTMSSSLRYREWSWQWQINCGNKMLEKGRVNTFKVKFSFVSSRGCAGVSAPLNISCSQFASHYSAHWLGITTHLNIRKKRKYIYVVCVNHACAWALIRIFIWSLFHFEANVTAKSWNIDCWDIPSILQNCRGLQDNLQIKVRGLLGSQVGQLTGPDSWC